MKANVEKLTRREAEIALLLLEGKSNKQIALALGITEHTVEFHLQNIYAKLQVGSRGEATVVLGKSRGILYKILGISGVETGDDKINNHDNELSISHPAESRSLTGVRSFIAIYKIPLAIILVLVLALLWILLLPKPAAWEKYDRECEYPDESTVGQMISRSNASGSRVHGQFGTTVNPPWPAQPGYVVYKNIRLPQLDQVYLRLRYSKDSPSTVPILVFIDDEAIPRASIFPIDQHDWNQFTWTEPIYLGKVAAGVHSIKFSTEGQQYGVADLDALLLTRYIP